MMAQDGSQGSYMAQVGIQDGSKMAQHRPRWPQDVTKMAQDASLVTLGNIYNNDLGDHMVSNVLLMRREVGWEWTSLLCYSLGALDILLTPLHPPTPPSHFISNTLDAMRSPQILISKTPDHD